MRFVRDWEENLSDIAQMESISPLFSPSKKIHEGGLFEVVEREREGGEGKNICPKNLPPRKVRVEEEDLCKCQKSDTPSTTSCECV